MAQASMYDHLSIGVWNLDRAVQFYDAALSPLGIARLWRTHRAAGYGRIGHTGEAPLALIEDRDATSAMTSAFHLALSANHTRAVDEFFAAAVAHGGSDDGPPGIREHYDPGYYAAFVRDPDGHRLEAVIHLGNYPLPLAPNRWLHLRHVDPFSIEEFSMFQAHCRVFSAYVSALCADPGGLGLAWGQPRYLFFDAELSADRRTMTLPLGGSATLASRAIIENGASHLLHQFFPLHRRLALEQGLTETVSTTLGTATHWRAVIGGAR